MTDLLTRLLGSPEADAGSEAGMGVIAEYVEGELEGRDVHTLSSCSPSTWGTARPARRITKASWRSSATNNR